jgi:hypothetical protein
VAGNGSTTGTQTYYVGRNPVEARELNNSTPQMTYV